MNNDVKRKKVRSLSSRERYNHSIKQFVILSKVWSLYDNGWALVSNGQCDIFPIWPDSFYAKECAKGEWSQYKPMAIDLNDFLEKYLPDFHDKKFEISVFMNANGNSIVVNPEELSNHLEYEVDKYYRE